MWRRLWHKYKVAQCRRQIIFIKQERAALVSEIERAEQILRVMSSDIRREESRLNKLLNHPKGKA